MNEKAPQDQPLSYEMDSEPRPGQRRSPVDYATALHRVMSLADLERMVVPTNRRPRYDLSRMHHLLRRLGDPHTRVPTVHVTGTKGKGSTCAMVTSILASEGYALGLYTSPHLHTVRERIRLDLSPLEEAQFANLVEEVWPAVREVEGGNVTTFELLTAMAFYCFVQTRRDIQVLEVGLGGTLDATNVVQAPQVCVLTSISLDHVPILGTTLEEIARDKAGIIKPGAIVVAAPQRPEVMEVIQEKCLERRASLVKVEEEYQWIPGPWDLEGQRFQIIGPQGSQELWMPLLGPHQLENAACALAVVDALAHGEFSVKRSSVTAGLEAVRWPGRLEVLGRSPLLVVDGAHNPYSMRKLVEGVQYHFAGKGCILVMGCTRGHDLEKLVAEAAALPKIQVLATRSRHPRSVPPEEIRRAFNSRGVPVETTDTVAEAVDRALALAAPQNLILGTGSLFLVAEMREHTLNIPPELYPELQGDPLSGRMI